MNVFTIIIIGIALFVLRKPIRILYTALKCWIFEIELPEPEKPKEPEKPRRVFVKRDEVHNVLNKWFEYVNAEGKQQSTIKRYEFWQYLSKACEKELPEGTLNFETGGGGRPYVETATK